MLSLIENIFRWCVKVIESDLFTVICGIITVIGFLMTVYISIKTKSIHKRIAEYKVVSSFNKNRKKYQKTFEGYQNAISQDDVDIYKTKINMLNDVNTVREAYSKIWSWRQKLLLLCLKKELEKKEGINVNKICNWMSKLIAVLSVEMEENYE